ncbi:hypothetical protein E2C01_086321 [Portunus trituberculatus]|uniref:Uncharacterized protein n=1 Tax=Portunus trituberculatus TaxID=210409 RepID=A0A5B7JB68_PORTR|nr:hypothetical protein [Portunus trituberculatus]
MDLENWGVKRERGRGIVGRIYYLIRYSMMFLPAPRIVWLKGSEEGKEAATGANITETDTSPSPTVIVTWGIQTNYHK